MRRTLSKGSLIGDVKPFEGHIDITKNIMAPKYGPGAAKAWTPRLDFLIPSCNCGLFVSSCTSFDLESEFSREIRC